MLGLSSAEKARRRRRQVERSAEYRSQPASRPDGDQVVIGRRRRGRTRIPLRGGDERSLGRGREREGERGCCGSTYRAKIETDDLFQRTTAGAKDEGGDVVVDDEVTDIQTLLLLLRK